MRRQYGNPVEKGTLFIIAACAVVILFNVGYVLQLFVLFGVVSLGFGWMAHRTRRRDWSAVTIPLGLAFLLGGLIGLLFLVSFHGPESLISPGQLGL